MLDKNSQNSNLPLVTVITSVLNGCKTLEYTIQSVLNQSYLNIEYIILDGGSTDGSLDIIRKYKDELAFWSSEKDGGIYHAWNKALTIAKGEWLSFIGSDDVYKLDAIYKMVEVGLKSNVPLDYISGKTELVYKNSIISIEGRPWKWSEFRKYVSTGHNGAIHNINLYKRYGVYDTSFRSSADYEFLLRPGKNLKAGFIDEVTTEMNLGGISNSSLVPILESYKARKKTKSINLFLNLYLLLKGIILWYLKRYKNETSY